MAAAGLSMPILSSLFYKALDFESTMDILAVATTLFSLIFLVHHLLETRRLRRKTNSEELQEEKEEAGHS